MPKRKRSEADTLQQENFERQVAPMLLAQELETQAKEKKKSDALKQKEKETKF